MLPTHQVKSALALAVALGAICAPTASAHPPTADPTQSPQPSHPASPVRVVSVENGFHWDDAGIGAAGGFALTMIGLGGGLAISQRRDRQASKKTAIPG
jgi:hypothetical protein